MKIKFINLKNKKQEEIINKNIIDVLYYNTHKIYNINDDIKNYISSLEGKIPLYDIYTSNLYLILPENLYYRITYNHYRFPTQYLLNNLEKEIKELEKSLNKDDIINIRKINKFNLMTKFLKNYNLKILEDTFYRTMYKNSPELGRNLLFCKRKSFNKYIHNSKPYYTRTEIINLARNMGKKLDLSNLKDEDVNKLCDFVSENDISADILLEHQKYIVSANLLGLIQYYTITGSANINAYLRNPELNYVENNTYNIIIENLTNLCINAPAFDKDYTVYRFIKNDNYLQHLRVGKVYTENSFMSTTRDPFYRSDTYSFGFILLKISIPANIKGIGLCLEGCSHFPEEQEIIFPPGSQFKLTARDEDITYYHTDLNYTSQIKTKYEFEWIGYKKIILNNQNKDELKNINFIDYKSDNSITLTERIKNFKKNLSITSRFISKIGDKDFTIIAENYNSISAYKKFFAITTNNGFSLYSIYNNYLLFMIEIGTVNDIDEMHINFYVKYNTLNISEILNITDLVQFFSEVAYYFAIDKVIIYSEYKPCAVFTGLINQRLTNINDNNDNNDDNDSDDINSDNINNIDMSSLIGNYCYDFYLYLKDKKKRFFDEKILEIELTPKFSYYDLDYLREININKFFDKSDDELYQIYDKYYKIEFPKDKLADYLVWIIENKCYLTDKFIKKLRKIYKINPFKRDLYVLNPNTYLYNRGFYTAYDAYYSSEITEREMNIIRTDEYKRINMLRE